MNSAGMKLVSVLTAIAALLLVSIPAVAGPSAPSAAPVWVSVHGEPTPTSTGRSLSAATESPPVVLSAGMFDLQVEAAFPARFHASLIDGAERLTSLIDTPARMPRIPVKVWWRKGTSDSDALASAGFWAVPYQDRCISSALYHYYTGGFYKGVDTPQAVSVRADEDLWDEKNAPAAPGVHNTQQLNEVFLHELLHVVGIVDRISKGGRFSTCSDNAAVYDLDRGMVDPAGTYLHEAYLDDPEGLTTATAGQVFYAGPPDKPLARPIRLANDPARPASALSHVYDDTSVISTFAGSLSLSSGLGVLEGLGWPLRTTPRPDPVVRLSVQQGPDGFSAHLDPSDPSAEHLLLLSWPTNPDWRAEYRLAAGTTVVPLPVHSQSRAQLVAYTMTTAHLSDPVSVLFTGTPIAEPPLPVPPAPAEPQVNRLSGPDRFATAAAVTAAGWPDGATTVVLATGSTFPDALAGAPLAAQFDAPVLLTSKDNLPGPTRAELTRLAPERIILLGGTGAVSNAVAAAAVRAAGGAALTRLSGSDRFATAAAIASQVAPSDTAYLATGASFPDALAGAVAAINEHAPVVLTTRDGLPRATYDLLAARRPSRLIVLGGTGAVSDATAALAARAAGGATIIRLSGPDRFATAAAIAAYAFPTADQAFVATGASFPDALVGTVLAARSGPLLLTGKFDLPQPTANYLGATRPPTVTVFGGQGAVAEGALGLLRRAIR